MASFGAVRRFVREDLGEDTISFSGLSWTTRFLILTGFGLLFFTICILIFADFVRSAMPLLTVPPRGTISGPTTLVGRGAVLPVALMPLTLLLLSISWSYILAGGLHVKPIVRLGILSLYLLTAMVWLNFNKPGTVLLAEARSFANFYGPWLLWGLFFAVPIFFGLRWRARPRPLLEFTALLVMVSASLAIAQASETVVQRIDDAPFVLPSVPQTIGVIQVLSVLLLFFIGIDIMEFAFRASTWTTNAIVARTHRWIPLATLGLLIVWGLYGVFREVAQTLGGSPREALIDYAGALSVPLVVGFVWWAVVARRGVEAGERLTVERMLDIGKKAAIPLVVVYFIFLFATEFVWRTLDYVVGALPGVQSGELVGAINRSIQGFWLEHNEQYQFGWRLFLAVLALSLTLLLVRRGSRYLALYLGIFGATELWHQLTDSNRPLEFLRWNGPEHMAIQEFVYGGHQDPVTSWWILILALIGLIWLLRGRLTVERVQTLLFLLLITWLLRHTEFIEDPISPISGLAGVGFLISFGVVWDLLTAGSWANADSPGLPRSSRVFLYLGYVLFSVTVINWSVATHNYYEVDLLASGAAINALLVFGRPLLYAILAVALASPAVRAASAPVAADPGEKSFGAREQGAWSQLRDLGAARLVGSVVAAGIVAATIVVVF